MSHQAMSLKAKIRNHARKKDMSAQVVLQSYMFERFLERLSKSDYKDKFILKGGMLIASIVGIENRATMDMDAILKNYPINSESLEKAIKDICMIEIKDDVTFMVTGIDSIRDDDTYGGFKVSIQADYDTIITPMQIDITTGDAITPEEVRYLFKMIFEEEHIGVWAYNIETVLAEKVETILSRGELNTRTRDFYDIYILTHTQKFNDLIFREALKKTTEHRKSTHIFNDIQKRIASIESSPTLETRWLKYTKNYGYASSILYRDVTKALRILMNNP